MLGPLVDRMDSVQLSCLHTTSASFNMILQFIPCAWLSESFVSCYATIIIFKNIIGIAQYLNWQDHLTMLQWLINLTLNTPHSIHHRPKRVNCGKCHILVGNYGTVIPSGTRKPFSDYTHSGTWRMDINYNREKGDHESVIHPLISRAKRS